MARHELTRVSQYSAKQMYDMAADVAAYHEFLPLVHESTVFDFSENADGVKTFKGRLLVKKKSLSIRESFVSDVVADPNNFSVVSKSSGGVLKSLTNTWKFEDLPEGGSKSALVVEYEIANLAMRLIMKASHGLIMDKLTEAFEKRADKLYAKGT